jgi:hypothetical protein
MSVATVRAVVRAFGIEHGLVLALKDLNVVEWKDQESANETPLTVDGESDCKNR